MISAGNGRRGRPARALSRAGAAAFCYVVRKICGWTANRAQEMAEATRLARLAAQLGKDDAVALAFGGLALGYVAGDFEGALALVDRALSLNPNLATAWYASGTVRAFRGGEPDVAIEHLRRAMRLSPRDPLMFTMQALPRSPISSPAGMKRRRHGLKKRSGNAQTSSPRCALRRPATRSPDDWRRREKLSRAPLSSTPTCALPISRIESGFFAAPKITQNMRMRCARPDCRNEPFGTTTHGLRWRRATDMFRSCARLIGIAPWNMSCRRGLMSAFGRIVLQNYF